MTETHLGEATTDSQGHYSIPYQRPSPLNLVVRAFDAPGKVIAQSTTLFAALAEAEIDFTTAPDGIVRTPSTMTTMEASISAQLPDTPLTDLKQNKDTHELQFLANATGFDFPKVGYLYVARSLGTKHGVRPATFFGLFHQAVPAQLNAALNSLPDGGIDDAFTGQVLSGILAHSRSILGQALTAAVKANIIPASYAAVQESELTLLDELRRQSVANSPYVRGKTSLNDLLSQAGFAEPLKTAFIQAYADNNLDVKSATESLRLVTTFPMSSCLNWIQLSVQGNSLPATFRLSKTPSGECLRRPSRACNTSLYWTKAIGKNASKPLTPMRIRYRRCSMTIQRNRKPPGLPKQSSRAFPHCNRP